MDLAQRPRSEADGLNSLPVASPLCGPGSVPLTPSPCFLLLLGLPAPTPGALCLGWAGTANAAGQQVWSTPRCLAWGGDLGFSLLGDMLLPPTPLSMVPLGGLRTETPGFHPFPVPLTRESWLCTAGLG